MNIEWQWMLQRCHINCTFNVLAGSVLVDNKVTFLLNQSSTVKPLAGLGSIACTFA